MNAVTSPLARPPIDDPSSQSTLVDAHAQSTGWLWPGGLHGRLALCLLAATVPLLALLFFVISADSRRVVANVEWQVTEAARLGAEQQEALFQNAAGLLQVLSRVPAVVRAGPACGELLAGVVAGASEIVSISVADAKGSTICSNRPASLGLSHAGQQYFEEAMNLPADRSYALGKMRASRIDNRPIVFMAVPLPPEAPGEQPAGTLLAALHSPWFAGLSNHLPNAIDALIQVLDSRDGALLASLPDPKNAVGLRFPDHPIVQAYQHSHTGGSVSAPGLDGIERIFAYAPLAGQNRDLLIAVGLSADGLRGDARERILVAIGAGLIVTFLAVLLSWRIAQGSLVGPLRAMSLAAARLGAGDMSCVAAMPASAPREIQALAGTFQRMVKRLQLRDRRIEAMQQELGRSEQHHRLLAETATDMITRFDANLQRIYVSSACRDLLGYEPGELTGEGPARIVYPEDWDELNRVFNQELLVGKSTARATYRAIRKDGTIIWVESSGRSLGEAAGFVVVTRDVSERKALEQQLAAANEKLTELARIDGLTGLANRRYFDEVLDKEMRRATRDGTPVAVILADVDRFKLFNDTYGHPAGDACLQAVARIIGVTVRRPPDLAARYGGEEFAVLLPGLDEQGAQDVARRISEALCAANLLHSGSERGRVTISIGVAAARPRPGISNESFIARADAALYRAKDEGRDRVCVASAGVLVAQ